MTTVKSVLKRATGFGGTTRQSPPMSDRELLKAKGNKDDFAFHNHRPDPIVHPEDFPDATSNVSNSSLSKEETGDPPAAAHAPCSSPGSQVPSCSQSSCGAEEADRSQGSIPSPKSVNFSEYVEPASKAKVTISDELDIEDSSEKDLKKGRTFSYFHRNSKTPEPCSGEPRAEKEVLNRTVTGTKKSWAARSELTRRLEALTRRGLGKTASSATEEKPRRLSEEAEDSLNATSRSLRQRFEEEDRPTRRASTREDDDTTSTAHGSPRGSSSKPPTPPNTRLSIDRISHARLRNPTSPVTPSAASSKPAANLSARSMRSEDGGSVASMSPRQSFSSLPHTWGGVIINPATSHPDQRCLGCGQWLSTWTANPCLSPYPHVVDSAELLRRLSAITAPSSGSGSQRHSSPPGDEISDALQSFRNKAIEALNASTRSQVHRIAVEVNDEIKP